MLVISKFSFNPALVPVHPAASYFGFIATAVQQNYCIYTQLFDLGLQALKAIKFGHLAVGGKTCLNYRQVYDPFCDHATGAGIPSNAALAPGR